MTVNKADFVDIDALMDEEFGAPGTDERDQFRKEAYVYYMGQILMKARKSEKITQAELASRTGMNKTYISRIEKGTIEPGIGTFGKIIDALGLRMEIVKPL